MDGAGLFILPDADGRVHNNVSLVWQVKKKKEKKEKARHSMHDY